MESTIKELINKALRECFDMAEVAFAVERPKELTHGDYATNVALVISKTLAKNLNSGTQDIAATLVGYINDNKPPEIADVSIAGPGFINFSLSKEFFNMQLNMMLEQKNTSPITWEEKRVMVEYTDPNPFKPFHIGHLMTNAIGESIARIITASGGEVIRANYQGDVGLHVAKAIWGIQQQSSWVTEKQYAPKSLLSKNNPTYLAQYIGDCYVFGSEKYDSDEGVKKEIDIINKKIYEKDDDDINAIYVWGREATLEAFETIYRTLGTTFDYYFFESDMAIKGRALVERFFEKGVFVKSDGAIVFKAEEYNPKLHTRVFITSNDLPTYETKELGLTETKFEKETLDQSIVITAVEQKDYMAVATEAMRQIHPEYAEKMKHITHGMMRFAAGKMSSRKGNVITGESLLNDAQVMALEKMKERAMDESVREGAASVIGVAAIKYAILRQALGGDIIYDPEQSVSFDGDSGPYLQYSTTRARSVIAKATELGIVASTKITPPAIYEIEKILCRFEETVEHAAKTLEPHHIATFLIDLASRFNSFYANEIIADPDDMYAPYKLALTKAFAQTMTNGLYLLGISVPEKM